MPEPEAGAQCVKRARWDLCGGRPEPTRRRAVPTATDFFTGLDQSWLVRFLEHRIADKRVLRLIQKWLAAGVIEDGEWSKTETGTAQGASVSPLLSNVFLHYVFDLWAEQWRRRNARGGRGSRAVRRRLCSGL